ncbi:MAG: FMN-binding negative transcriptional regulator [Kiloniellales bacterium]|nr:FMN-binding negative transcriptional regulator [Kiloniellales bacterium]
MYVPEVFGLDAAAAGALVRDNSFGLLVTVSAQGLPQASHLPFLFEAPTGEAAGEPQGRLLGHLARANPQWHDLAALAAADGKALVVFQGAHGYVSPSWYAPGPAVPTWNYLAVHIYGRPRILEAEPEVAAILDRLVAAHEAGAAKPWSQDGQDPKYLARMRRGIVAFEIPVARMEAKAKLSQNRSAADRRQVIEALEAAQDPEARALAAEMRDKAAEPL